MTKEFVPYELAVKLKALGFDEPCFGYYYNKQLSFGARTSYGEVIEAPTFSQAFRWFREEYQLFGGILSEYSYGGQINAYHITGKRQGDISKGDFTTYEEAELACLDKLIEIVEKK